MKKLLILSGKGGTGKTTIASAFIRLMAAEAFADCDVDAPNLHLIVKQKTVPERNDYFGMGKAEIDTEKCTSCGLCERTCRFGAILSVDSIYRVDGFSCEACGVCEAICPSGAIKIKPAVAGDLMLYKDNDTAFSTAKLRMGNGTSGKLVTEVKKQLYKAKNDADIAIIDGSPGIGCPVIASITGVDLVLIVSEPSLSGISDMERIVETAQKFGIKTAVCINKYDTNIDNTAKIEKICEVQGLPFAGRIPFDTNVIKLLNMNKSIIETQCEATEAIKSVYEKTMRILRG